MWKIVLMNCFWAEGHRDLDSSQPNHTTSEKGLRRERYAETKEERTDGPGRLRYNVKLEK